jgi:ribosome-associated protein
MHDVFLHEATIELYKLLKLQGLVASGGEAKALIAAGQVRVNGQTETRKRKKVAAGDVIELHDQALRVCGEAGSSG